MPLRFGGDMDSRDNPASPFISRDEAEEMAAEQMGINLDKQRDEQNAAEIAFIDQYVGTKFDQDPNPALARMVAFSKDAMRTMLAAAEEISMVLSDYSLGDTSPTIASRLSLAEHELREKVPLWYGTDPSPRGG